MPRLSRRMGFSASGRGLVSALMADDALSALPRRDASAEPVLTLAGLADPQEWWIGA